MLVWHFRTTQLGIINVDPAQLADMMSISDLHALGYDTTNIKPTVTSNVKCVVAHACTTGRSLAAST